MLKVDQVRVDPVYREALEQCGLTRVGDILSRTDGRVTAWSRTTDTIHIPGRDGAPGFYLKRYRYPTWTKRLRGTFRGTFFGVHRGQAEYGVLRRMRALGICAVRPVAYGSRRIGHFVAACFLVTEEVPGSCNLTTFAREVATGRRRLGTAARRTLVERLADQIASMHGVGFSHGQLYWRNIVVRTGADGALECFLLDAQPLRRWQRVGAGAGWWKHDLAHLAVSAIPFTRRTERLRFLLRYLGGTRVTPAIKHDIADIEALAQARRKHEMQRIKMNDLFETWNRQLVAEYGQASAVSAGVRPAPGTGP